MKCEKCGMEMKEIKSAFTTGMECPNCGWGWVTTLTDDIATDTTDYEIWLEPGNLQSVNNIKLIANITNMNMINAKKMLSENEAKLLFKVVNENVLTVPKAQCIREVAKELKEHEINYKIVPEFPYDI